MSFSFLNDESLLARCSRGAALLGAGSAAERGIRFIRNMILARLLAPEHFGLMALVLAASQLFEALTEMGVRQAVVQNRNGADERYLNAAWWISAVRGLFLYAVGWAAAPRLAAFYEAPALTGLLRAAFLVLPLQGFISPGLYVLEKRLRFKGVVFVVQGGGLAGTVVSLVLALFHPNVWALVAGFVAEMGFQFVGSFFIYPFRPRFRFDRQAGRELFHFSRGMVGLPILTYLFMQADIFVLGRLETRELLGYYSMALTLAAMPQMLFSRVASPLVLPVFSEMQDQKERLGNNFVRMTSLLSLFGLPMVVCLSVFAQPMLTVIYGARYGQVQAAFALLNVYTLLYMAGILIASVYMAVGRPGLHRSFTLLRIVLIAMTLYPAVRSMGVTGAAGAKVLSMFLAGLVQLVSLKRLLDLPVRRYVRAGAEGLGPAAVVSVPALMWRFWIESPLLQVLGAAVLCLAAWGFAALSLRRRIHDWPVNLKAPEAEIV